MYLLQQTIKSLFDSQLVAKQLSNIPELTLYLLDENTENQLKKFSSEQVETIWQNMPYWAFAWSSGVALSQYIYEHPELVRDQHIVDFGAGSGIVGLTCLLVGAKSVTCCDIDPLALKACEYNSKLNGLEVKTCDNLEDAEKPDMIVVGDILYDTRNHKLAKQLFALDLPIIWAESKAQTTLIETGPEAVYAGETQPNIGGFDEHKDIHIYYHRGNHDYT